MFTLEIDTSTIAFDNGNKKAELARLLREAARKIEHGADCFYLHDKDGKLVSYCLLGAYDEEVNPW